MPPDIADIFSAMMVEYRREAEMVESPQEKEEILEELLELL